MNKRMKV